MTPAVFAVTNVEVTAGQGLFQATGPDPEVRRLPPRAAAGRQAGGRRCCRRCSEQQALDQLDLIGQPALHPAAAALQRGVAGQDAGEGRHRPAEHLRDASSSTIQDRGYVEQKDRRFFATEIGKIVTDLLVEHFPKIMDLKFTSHFEEELDDIETRQDAVRRGARRVLGAVLRGAEDGRRRDAGSAAAVETGEKCPKCGRPLVEHVQPQDRQARSSAAPGCKDDPPCKYIKPGEGEQDRSAIERSSARRAASRWSPRTSRWGTFLSCSAYKPDGTGCKTIVTWARRQAGRDVQADASTSARSAARRCCWRRARRARTSPARTRSARPSLDADKTGEPGQAGRHRAQLREVRLADGGQEGLARAVPVVQRLPEVPQREVADGRAEGEAQGRAAGPAAEEGSCRRWRSRSCAPSAGRR